MPENGHRNGSWRNTVIGAFGGLFLLFAGWMLNEAAAERRSMDTKIDENRNRIAVLEAKVQRLTNEMTEHLQLHREVKR